MDAAEYKHVVLGLIFLKYISDAFTEVYEKLKKEKDSDPEDVDEYVSRRIFFVPKEARWEHLQANAKKPEIGKFLDEEIKKNLESIGWKVGKLGDFIEFVKGKKPSEISETFVEGYLPQILIENIDGKEPVFTNAYKLTVVQETEPIMVMDGASSGRIEIGHKGILGSTLAKVVAKDDSLKNSYLLYFLKNYQEEINQNTTGTSIPHTDKERIKRFLIALPNKRLLDLFDKLANNILYTIINNKREIKSLAVIRDSLLPKLISGKIRVPVEV